jgi:tetratricopeptide (TPR) repeat protein
LATEAELKVGVAISYMAFEHYTEAMKYFQLANEIFIKINDIEGKCCCLYNLSDIEYKQGKFKSAIEKIDIVYNESKKYGIAEYLSLSSVFKAILHLAMDTPEALSLTETALKLCKDLQGDRIVEQLYSGYSQWLANKKEFENALYYKEKLIECIRNNDQND